MTRYTHMYEPVDPRLGRHVNHDPAAANYPLPVKPRSALQPVRWARAVSVFDQGQLGSCTANAGTGFLATASAAAGPGRTSATISAAGAKASHGIFLPGTYALDESFAVMLYELATRIDPFPGQYKPTDTGSDGPSVAAALKLLQITSGYSHAFSIGAAQTASQTGSMLWGTVFLYSMENPDADGYFVVDPSSGVAGGHEMVLSGYDPATDVWVVDNSWGTSWGVNGSALLHGKDLAYLLSQKGDITVPTFAAVPVPPVPPTPPPVPPVITDADLWAYAKAWAAGNGLA